MGLHDESPFSAVGRAHQEIDELRRALNDKAEDSEVRSLSNRLDSLEYTVRSIESALGGMESRMQELQTHIETIENKNPGE